MVFCGDDILIASNNKLITKLTMDWNISSRNSNIIINQSTFLPGHSLEVFSLVIQYQLFNVKFELGLAILEDLDYFTSCFGVFCGIRLV